MRIQRDAETAIALHKPAGVDTGQGPGRALQAGVLVLTRSDAIGAPQHLWLFFLDRRHETFDDTTVPSRFHVGDYSPPVTSELGEFEMPSSLVVDHAYVAWGSALLKLISKFDGTSWLRLAIMMTMVMIISNLKVRLGTHCQPEWH